MKIKKLLIAASVALAAASISGIAYGAAQASTPSNPPSEEQPQAADTDNIQEGDQSGADDATEAKTPEGKDGAESPGESDGLGGHEDPPGDVNHEFDGEE